MNAIELIQQGFDNVHQVLRDDMAQVDADWLFWQPQPHLNHIGFLYWHLVRDEDTVVSGLTRRRQLWDDHGWYQRLGFEPEEQGTGMDPERLASFRYDLKQFQEYAEAVWERTGPLIGTLTEGVLDQPAWPDSDWDVGRQLVEGCLCHCWVHLGEIRYIMGLRGWRFHE